MWTSVCAGCGVLVEWVLGAVEAGGPCRPSLCVVYHGDVDPPDTAG